MRDEKPMFGAKSERLDRLVSHVLDESEINEQGAPTASLDALAESIGGWIGRYKLLQVLGEGGMGVVYLAEQDHPIRRQVALKVIKPGMDSKRVLARFETEQQALALMEHPHIARVYDAGLAPSGRPYFVMEHVKGIPITEHCDRYRLTIEERLHLFLHVCNAVQHAHQKGIIHRDLKPSNILVTIQDQEVIPKVIDFGVARAISQPLTERTLFTEQGQLLGTPEYMSPEQADPSNQDIDTRTDVYSLGVVLYELLAGVLPFDPKTFRAGGIDHIRKVICEEDAKTPSTRLSKTSAEESAESARRRQTDVRTLRHKLHGDLDWITLKAIARDRTRRYATVDALATDIRNHLNHQPVSAAPPGTLYRVRKLARRHRQALAVAGAVLILLAVALWGGWTFVRAARERTYTRTLEQERRLAEAQEAFGARKWSEVLAKIEPLLDSPNVGRKARLLHARLALEQQGPVAAVPELESLLEMPDEIAGQAHFLLANIYREGDPCTPGQTDGYARLWKDHREQAEQLIADTATFYFLRAQASQDVAGMLAMLGKTLELDRQHYDALRERAHLYYTQGDHYEMAMDAACMITAQPRNPQGYDLKAVALREMGRFDEALQNHKDAIELSPDDPELHADRCETYMRMGRYEPALDDAQRCTDLRPEDLTYRHKLFAALTLLGQYDRAQEQYIFFKNDPRWQGYMPDIPDSPNLFFLFFSTRLVVESLAANRPWYCPTQPPPHQGPYGLMYETDADYRYLRGKARRVISKGFHPSWSPDASQLAYSHGFYAASGVAIFTLETGRTELLTTAGTDPAWSPDGRYIAFVRNRSVVPPDRLTGLTIRTLRPDRVMPLHVEEVWIIDLWTREIRRIAEGRWPQWGLTSRRLYYTSGQDKTLYSVSIEAQDGKPTPVLSNCWGDAIISPDERYAVDCRFRELRIVDIRTGEIAGTWIAPPSPRPNLYVCWSPDGREVSIGGWVGSQMGLWIYDVAAGNASKVLNGCVMTAPRAPDGRKLALSLGVPFMEIWLVDLEPGISIIESLGSAGTNEEHCRDFMAFANRVIESEPTIVEAYYLRADCALWMGHEKAAEYLEQFRQVLTSYDAPACANQAKEILDSPPQLRDRLLPLALLLAQKAVAKDPNNPDYLKVLDRALHPAAE